MANLTNKEKKQLVLFALSLLLSAVCWLILNAGGWTLMMRVVISMISGTFFLLWVGVIFVINYSVTGTGATLFGKIRSESHDEVSQWVFNITFPAAVAYASIMGVVLASWAWFAILMGIAFWIVVHFAYTPTLKFVKK